MTPRPSILALALLPIVAGALFGAPPGKIPPGNEQTVLLPLAGSAWEVKYPDSPKGGPDLYRFDASGRFSYRSSRAVFIFNESARWKAERERFEAWVPDIDWRATGTFTNEKIRGTVIGDGETTAFEGRRVDPTSYQFPLAEGEAIVTVRLRGYIFDWPWPEPDELEEYLKKDDGSDLKHHRKEFIGGLVFEVMAPKEYRGKYITAHHDGFLASGDATQIAEPGKEYLLRIGKQEIGKKDFSLCSVDLCIKLASDKRPLNP
jgi:hypothetical protein